jgi:hypothetical protein
MFVPPELTKPSHTAHILALIIIFTIPVIFFFFGKNIGEKIGLAMNLETAVGDENQTASEVQLTGPSIYVDINEPGKKAGILHLADGWKAAKVTEFKWSNGSTKTFQTYAFSKGGYKIIIYDLELADTKCPIIGSLQKNYISFPDKDNNIYIRPAKASEQDILLCYYVANNNYNYDSPYGSIKYHLPQNADESIMKEMDTIISSFKLKV